MSSRLWEEAGVFHAEPGGRLGGQLLDRDPAPERDRLAAHGARAQREHPGRLHPGRADARHAGQVDLRHRSRRHRHAAGGRARPGRGRDHQGGTGPGALRRARLAVARAVRQHDHRPVQAPRRLARLRGTSASRWTRTTCARSCASSRRSTRRATSTATTTWSTGTRAAHRDLRPRGGAAHRRGHALPDRLPARVGSGAVTVATVRPETMLADTAIAVNPTDERYSRLIGEAAVLPLVGRRLPILADDYVDPEFGTGALKITPGHDPNDFEIGRRHGLEEMTVIGEDGRITDAAPEAFRGHGGGRGAHRGGGRAAGGGAVSGTRPWVHDVPHSHRSGRRIEPLISLQWFCDMSELAKPAIEAVRDGRAALPPRAAVDRGLPRLAREHPALVHLAPALVGPPAARLVPRATRPTWAPSRRRARAGSATRTCWTPGSRPACGRSPPSAGPRRRPSSGLLPHGRALDRARHHLPLGRPHGDVRDGAHGRAALHRRADPLRGAGARRAPHVEVARNRDRPARPDRRRPAPARVRGGRRVPRLRRRCPALRPARHVLLAGRALQRGAGQAGPRPREQALERVAADPAARGGRRGRRRAPPRRSRTAGSSRGWSA